MNEQQARTVLWIKAIEENDPQGQLLPRAERSRASREAGLLDRAEPGGTEITAEWTPQKERFVARRAELLREALERTFPGARARLTAVCWPSWMLLLLLAGAFAAGVFANYLGPERRISILAFPLLGVLAWNVAVYLVLLLRTVLKGTARDFIPPLPAFLTRLVFQSVSKNPGPAQDSPTDRVWQAASSQFQRVWWNASFSLYGTRIRIALHLGSALLALGILAGMYLRGLGYEYLAGWESTFLNADSVHRLLGPLLAPASLLTGIPVPDLEHLERIRWREGRPGENAAPWIHLYAVTALLVVFLPRLSLALAGFIRLKLTQRRFPFPGGESPYFRRLGGSGAGEGLRVLVLPYSYSLEPRGQEALRGLLSDCLGWSTQVDIRPPLPYGGEEALLEEWSGTNPPSVDYVLVLFNLAATPEAETHGRLLSGLRALGHSGKGGRLLLVLLEESPFRRQLAGQPLGEARLAERTRAWVHLMERHGFLPIAVWLDQLDLDFSCEQLRQAASAAAPVSA